MPGHNDSTRIEAVNRAATWGLTGVFVRLLHDLPTLTIAAGRLMIVAASAAYAVGLRARAQSERPLDPLVLTVMACVIGAIVSFFLLGHTLLTSALPRPSPMEFGYLILLGCVCTAVPTLAFGVASARLVDTVVRRLVRGLGAA